MKNSLYQSLLSRLKNKHIKLATRFHKSVKDGEFQKQRYRQRRDAVERLKNVERQISILGKKSGLKPKLNFKHWAVALAMGVVVSANAQTDKKSFEERLKRHANRVINNVQPLAQSVFYDPKAALGAPPFNSFLTGDIDGDGDIDGIYVAYIDSPLILTNEGSLNFSVAPLTTDPLQIIDQVVLADFDNDGDLDLFMRNGTYGAFGSQMWQNDGSGNFSSQSATFPTVDFNDDVVAAVDYDNDGDLDIIAETSQDTSPYYSYVTLFENTSFDFSDTTALKGSDASFPQSRLVSVMDVDGDTDLEIVYTSLITSFGQALQVFDNDGAGNFTDTGNPIAPTYSFNNGAKPFDFDNDGDLDIIGFISAPNLRVQSMENDGTVLGDASSNFTENTPIILSPSGDEDDIFPFKIDTDNFDDFVADSEDSTFVYTSNGDGTFTELAKFVGVSKPEDLDADGDGDLFYFDGNASIRENQGGGTFDQGADIVTISSTYDTQLVDIDGDGDLDLVQGGSIVSRSWINDGLGGFTVNQEFPGDAYQLAFGDLDGDSDLDMVVAIEGYNDDAGFIIYTNNGSGTFSYDSNLGTGYETQQVFIADMDEDGDLDIVVNQDGLSTDFIVIYDNEGSLTFSNSSSIVNANYGRIDVGNIDGDSDPDIVMAVPGEGSSSVTTIINNNGSLIAGSSFTPSGSNYDFGDVDIADFDGDGDMDVFASNAYESPTTNSYLFLNNGTGTLTDSGQTVETGGTYNSFVGDVDDDGDVDVISGGYISYPKLWVNDGSGNLAFDHDIPTITTEYSSVNIGDIDGDGDNDMIISDYYGGTQIFLNTGSANQLEADAAALTAIFDNMDGTNWTNSSNWGDADVSTWHGVTLNSAQDRVERLELPNNGLVGTLPAAVDNLDALEILDLSDNEIDELATDFSGLVNAVDINLNSNNLDFGDLEAVAGVAVLSYTNQQALAEGINENGPLEIPIGSSQELTANANGTANTYQWIYEGQNIPGATGTTYNITDIDRSNMGSYSLEISNSIATGVTLSTAPIDVLATAVISLDVDDGDGNLLTENVNGYLLIVDEEVVGFDTLSAATQLDVSSSFSFPPVVLREYLVNASSDENQYIATYYGNSFLWDEADTLVLNSDTTIQIVITETPPTLTAADGDGLVEGTIEEDFEDDGSRIDARRRAAKRKCGMRRKRSGGRTEQGDDEFELIAYGETNDQGEFEYGFLPQGTYRFFVEYPGIPLDESAFIEFEVGEAGVGDNSFKLAVFASEDGIFIELVLGASSADFAEFSIFPNPTDDLININYHRTNPGDLTLEIYDLKGKELLKQTLNGNQENISIDISDFKKGQYIFRLIDENRNDLIIYKIIKN